MMLSRADMRYLGKISDKLRELDASGSNAGISDIPGITPYLTMECPECGEIPEHGGNSHILANTIKTWSLYPESPVVLIGCEGYHILNPELIGMDREGWDDWTEYLE